MLRRKILSLYQSYQFPAEIFPHLLEKSLIENFIFCAVLLLWIYSRRPSGYLWFNGPRKSPVAGLN